MLKKYVLLMFCMLFLSGCMSGPKYIPISYFSEDHSMAVTVRGFPSASHNITHHYETDPLKKLEKGLEATQRTFQLQNVFQQINNEEIRAELKKDIEERAKKIFKITSDHNDLALEISIEKWGWIIPEEGIMGLRLGSFQLYIDGRVNVYDLRPSKKLIGTQYLSARENISDHMSASENKRAIQKVMNEFAENVTEFLWRSDAKEERVK